MNAEEEARIRKLLDDKSSMAEQKAALTWFANYLEEGDILNLPPSRRTLDCLKKFTQSNAGDGTQKARAEKLLKNYRF